MTPTEANEHIRARIKAAGVDEFSARYDISPGHLKAVLERRAQPGARTARAAGLVMKDGEWRVV